MKMVTRPLKLFKDLKTAKMGTDNPQLDIVWLKIIKINGRRGVS